MRRTYAGVAIAVLLALGTAGNARAACTASDTVLCLNGARFSASVHWQDSNGRSGDGHAIPITADTGYYWFFSPSNIELVVKALDGRPVNGKYWLFFGALSNVQYTLTVTDTVTGAQKQYVNPSGQFASVGDTSAFDPDGAAGIVTAQVDGTFAPPESVAAVQRLIDASVETKAASDFVPCASAPDNLSLDGCRFRLDVHWTTSNGKSGQGTGVQLTDNTGYFWFFADTNVELMVKVLDARGVNGNYWVFFGALSNVEYTVRVFDTVSGAVRTYHNAPSTFASVGDTSAFRGGFGISVATDAARTAAGTITNAAGGSLSTTGADGTVFTLTVPPQAIAYDEDISMTPVATVSGFPFAGGLAAGVALEPPGLLLLTGATLTIHTPSAVPSAQETPVAWNGSGEDFFLFPPEAAAGDLTLFITHLGGYGVARATADERTAQLAHEPLEAGDRLQHRISPFLLVGRSAAVAAQSANFLPETTDWQSDTKAELDAEYIELNERRQAVIDTGDADVCIGLVNDFVTYENLVQSKLGPIDTVFPNRSRDIHLTLVEIVNAALERIFSRCLFDPKAIDGLPGLYWVATEQGLTADTLSYINQSLRCLTFTLNFTSNVTGTYPTSQGVLKITESVKGQIVLKTPAFPSLTKGTGSVQGVSASVSFAPSNCTFPYTSSTASISAYIDWDNLFANAKSVKMRSLRYNVSDVASTIKFNCPDSTPNDKVTSWWWELYLLGHQGSPDGFGYLYKRDGFILTGGQFPWATAHQDESGTSGLILSESTDFKIDHTPQ